MDLFESSLKMKAALKVATIRLRRLARLRNKREILEAEIAEIDEKIEALEGKEQENLAAELKPFVQIKTGDTLIHRGDNIAYVIRDIAWIYVNDCREDYYFLVVFRLLRKYYIGDAELFPGDKDDTLTISQENLSDYIYMPKT